MEKGILRQMRRLLPSLMKVGRQMWMDYDKGADVLYISFERHQNANDSEMQDDAIIHKRRKKVVGLTFLNASQFYSS